MEFSFTSSDYESSLAQVAIFLGNQPKDNVISFDEFVGKGTVNIAPLEAGLFVRVWDFVLKDDVTVNMMAEPEKRPFTFMAKYILTPSGFDFSSLNEPELPRVANNTPALLLLSNSRNAITYRVLKKHPIKCFEICINTEWLGAQILKNDTVKAEKLVLEKTGDFQLTNNISVNDYAIAEELQQKIFDGTMDKIYLRSRLLLLVNSMVQQHLLGEKSESPLLNRYAPNLAKVEQFLKESLYGKLPDLEKLAQRFSMSQSTLKRQFRALYGKNIYEYYLEKKIELAARLIKEGNLTISEIAFKLGYEKVSSFSAIFKKLTGKTPASISTQKPG